MEKQKFVNKQWGHEVWIINTDEYCGKQIYVRNQWSSGGKYHYHMKKDETFYVINGVLILDIYKDQRYQLSAGSSYRIRPTIAHRFKSHGISCTFIEFSTHHEDSDSYYL